MVYRSDCRYSPYSIHLSEFMSILFHEKTDKIRKYSKSHQRLSGMQSIILREPIFKTTAAAAAAAAVLVVAVVAAVAAVMVMSFDCPFFSPDYQCIRFWGESLRVFLLPQDRQAVLLWLKGLSSSCCAQVGLSSRSVEWGIMNLIEGKLSFLYCHWWCLQWISYICSFNAVYVCLDLYLYTG